MLSRLGTTQFSLWALVAPLAAYGSLLNLGVGSALIKYVAEYRARGENDEASEVIATGLALYCALGAVAIVTGVILAPFVPSLLHVPASQHHTATVVTILAAVGVGVELPATTSFSVLQGLARYDLINVIASLAIVSIGLCIATVLLLGGNVIAVVASIIPLTFIWQVPAIWAIHRTAPEIRFGFRGARLRRARHLTSFGSAMFGIQVSNVVNLQTDEFVIGAAIGVRHIAPYSVARRLATLPGQLAAQFVAVLLPVASQLQAEGDGGLLASVFVAGMRLSTGLYVAVGGGLIVFAHPFLAVWVGHGVARSADIVVLLTLAGLSQALLAPATQMLQGMSRHRPLVAFALGAGLLNLALSIALVGPLGVAGVAGATLIATAVQALFVVPFALRVLGIRATQLAREAGLPVIAPVIPMAAVLVAIREWIAPATVPWIALSGIAGAAVYAAIYLSFPAAARERGAALGLVRAARRLLRGAGGSR